MAIRKSIAQIAKDFIERIEKAGEFYLDRSPAFLGNYSRVVEVPGKNGFVYARLQSGQVVEAYNTIAPNIHNWAVEVGRDKSQPEILRVIKTRYVHNIREQVAYILFHHKQHEFPQPDTVWIYRDQFMPLLVFPAGGMSVTLYGDVVYDPGMTNPIRINDTVIDMTSHIPATGAKYVLLEIETDGSLNYVTGSAFDSREILLVSAPIPAPTLGSFPVCAFVMFAGQAEIRRDSERRDIIDLRMFVGAGGSNAHTHPTTELDDLADIDAPTPNDGDVLMWNAADSEWQAQTLASGAARALQIVMEPGLDNPPVPVENVDGTDYVYYEVII